jgi:L-alanine-DL-glutamate epimerase-like enolase superfamily enzyme
MSETHLTPDANGEVRVPASPGLGVTMSAAGMRKYLVEVEIAVKGAVLYRSTKI